MQPLIGLQMWFSEGQLQASAQSCPKSPSGHSNSQRVPVKPWAHWHRPSTLLHLAPLWQKHSWTQSGPNLPSGHDSVQCSPIKPPGQRHLPVTWWQSAWFLHPHSLLQPSP